MKKILFICMSLLLLVTPGCKDQFADINTDPEKTEADVRFLFTEALRQMKEKDYYIFFWNSKTIQLWNQTTASSTGNTDGINISSELQEEYLQMIAVKKHVEGIRFAISQMNENEAATFKYIEAMCNPIMIYMGVFSIDLYGSIPYSEAGKAFYTNPPVLTPVFETQEELLNLWLTQLDESIKTLSTNVVDASGRTVSQVPLNNQDFVYKGDAKKWVKFANSLKLKIAARLINVDRARAIKIAEEVAQYPVLDGLSDDFIWAPDANYYNTGNDLGTGVGGIQIVDFMVKNKDPRVRFLFRKNDFNEEIAAAFIEKKGWLPSFIDKYVEYTADGKFGGWKAPGEPWVRYHGTPIDFQARNDSRQNDYFDSDRRKLTIGDSEKTYTAVSGFQEEMLRGQIDFSYPSLPGVTPKQDIEDMPIYLAYLTTAEVNLYFAEFKLLGANLPSSAAEYYSKGIEMSVKVYDHLANMNSIPYYRESTGLPTDETIELRDGEIDTLLSQADYQLTGSVDEQLEKVYVQQYLHFAYYPNDQFTLMRRSGVPIKGSAYYPYVQWDANNPDYIIPRRKQVRSLTQTDAMYENKKAAFEQQGFTPGSNEPSVLATERVWYDKNNPNYGNGPKN